MIGQYGAADLTDDRYAYLDEELPAMSIQIQKPRPAPAKPKPAIDTRTPSGKNLPW